MNLRDYLLDISQEEREQLASDCGTSVGHLRNVAYGKKAGEALCMDIERLTGGRVTCEELRPDLTAQWSYMRSSQLKAA